jgi:hypothetical protein
VPVRLSVTYAAVFIFAVEVANADVATVIFINGSMGRDKFKLPPI